MRIWIQHTDTDFHMEKHADSTTCEHLVVLHSSGHSSSPSGQSVSPSHCQITGMQRLLEQRNSFGKHELTEPVRKNIYKVCFIRELQILILITLLPTVLT
jgi:hypothetical protein